MKCPYCEYFESKVIDTRPVDDYVSIRRRRECGECGKRFTTFERVELNMPTVVKRTGLKREYDREKIRASMKLALRKRPVGNDRIEEAIGFIEQQIRTLGEREVTSMQIGEFVLEQLKKLDLVAYIRFASVYFNVENPEGFQKLMRELEGIDRRKH